MRRGSFEPEDLFHAHIAGMDSFAVGLKVAQKLLDNQVLESVIEDRYQSYTDGIGLDIVEGKADFHKLEDHVLDLTEINHQSGKLERLKATINQYMLNAYANN